MAKIKDALSIMDEMVKDDPEMETLVAEVSVNAEIAQLIYDARVSAGITQTQLAKLIEATQSVIARLEDADYEGHSISMLQRIASALNRKTKIILAPKIEGTEAV